MPLHGKRWEVKPPNLNPGKYSVAHCSHILYNPAENYLHYGYHGPSPIFLNIWYPKAYTNDTAYLKLGDFRNIQVPEDLKGVYHQLQYHMDESLIRDALTYNLADDQPIAYTTLTVKEVLALVKQLPSRSSLIPCLQH